MKPLVVLFGGSLVYLSLLACLKSQEVREAKINSLPTASPNVLPTSVDGEPQRRGSSNDKFAFDFGEHEVQLNAETKIVSKRLRVENTELKFKIDISFPQIEGPASPEQSKFNSAVAQLARENFNEYKRVQLRPKSKAERFPRYHEDVVEFLEISYDVPFAADNLLSIRFNAHTYGRGAAHSVQYFFVFNYDLKSVREIKLSDLFRPNSNHLAFISSYACEIVKKRICSEGGWAGTQAFSDCLKNPPLWEDGIKAKADNFKAWNFTKEGLLFSFDACQLTGCASGEFYVNVAYDEIRNLSKRGSIVARFL
jgi:hypothetical protein